MCQRKEIIKENNLKNISSKQRKKLSALLGELLANLEIPLDNRYKPV